MGAHPQLVGCCIAILLSVSSEATSPTPFPTISRTSTDFLSCATVPIGNSSGFVSQNDTFRVVGIGAGIQNGSTSDNIFYAFRPNAFRKDVAGMNVDGATLLRRVDVNVVSNMAGVGSQFCIMIRNGTETDDEQVSICVTKVSLLGFVGLYVRKKKGDPVMIQGDLHPVGDEEKFELALTLVDGTTNRIEGSFVPFDRNRRIFVGQVEFEIPESGADIGYGVGSGVTGARATTAIVNGSQVVCGGVPPTAGTCNLAIIGLPHSGNFGVQENKDISIVSNGPGLGNVSDDITYLYRPWALGEVIETTIRDTNSSFGGEDCIMLRESLDPNAATAGLCVFPGSVTGAVFLNRLKTGTALEALTNALAAPLSFPITLRLVSGGTAESPTMSAFVSSSEQAGHTFAIAGSEIIGFSSGLVGLVVTEEAEHGVIGKQAKALFDGGICNLTSTHPTYSPTPNDITNSPSVAPICRPNVRVTQYRYRNGRWLMAPHPDDTRKYDPVPVSNRWNFKATQFNASVLDGAAYVNQSCAI